MNTIIHTILIGSFILIIILNYYYLNNPKPYPSTKVRENFGKGIFQLSDFKYIGFSQYYIPKLIKTESNWVNGLLYWHKSAIKIGVVGIIVMLLTIVIERKLIMILGEKWRYSKYIFDYSYTVGVIIFSVYIFISFKIISNKMDNFILKD